MKTTIELDKKLTDGELLIYKNGVIKSIEIHELLPELVEYDSRIGELEEVARQDYDEITVLKERDLFIAKSIYDNYVERGVIEENEDFDNMWIDYIFNGGDLDEEAFPEDFIKILNKVRD